MQLDFGPKAYFNFSSHAAFGSSLRHWLHLLWRHRSEIDWPFIPKIIYITFVILFNAPVAAMERRRYGKQIKATNLQPPVFILGHPRSGTTYLHYIMSKDPQFAYCKIYESFMPWTFLSSEAVLVKIMKKALPETRPMDNLKLGVNQPKEEEFALGCMGEESIVTSYYFPRKMYRHFQKQVLFENNAEGAKRWGENMTYFLKKLTLKYGDKPLLLKSPYNTARVKELLKLFPDARFIHIYRNPYPVYWSNVRLYEKTLPFLALQKVTREPVESFILQSYRDTYQKYLKDKALIPEENLIEFAYEDFIGNELGLLRQAYQKLRLGDFEAVKHHLQSEVREYEGYQPNRYDMNESLKAKIYQEWEFAFEAFGYKE